MRVLHVLTDLEIGGAQRMALHLLARRDASIEPTVVGLKPGGRLAPKFSALAPTTTMGISGPQYALRGLHRLRTLVRQTRPDVVQTWMYHADLVGGLASAGLAPVVWNIRQSAVRSPSLSKSTTAVTRLEAWLSRRIPAAIVCCSAEAREAHVAAGFDPSKMLVIENGFELAPSAPSAEARAALRRELGLPATAQVIVTVGRLDPEKDQLTFLRAFDVLRRRRPGAHAVLVGPEAQDAPPAWSALLGSDVHLLGMRDDVASILAGVDLFVSSSRSEGFPNAVGEAMVAGIATVVTDVGGTRRLVGDTGRIVGAEDPAGLAAAMDEVLAMDASERVALGARGRERVAEHFDIGAATARYERLYREVAEGRPVGSA